MENLSKHTPTVLLKMINDIKITHDKLKQEIIEETTACKDSENQSLRVKQEKREISGSKSNKIPRNI